VCYWTIEFYLKHPFDYNQGGWRWLLTYITKIIVVYSVFDKLIVDSLLPSLIEMSRQYIISSMWQSHSEFSGRLQYTLYSSLLLKPSELCYLCRRTFLTCAAVVIRHSVTVTSSTYSPSCICNITSQRIFFHT
jgi:hypothetical protein